MSRFMLKHKLSNFFMQGLVIGLITLALSFNALGAEDPWLHLEKASQAARKLSYKGIFLYQNCMAILKCYCLQFFLSCL